MLTQGPHGMPPGCLAAVVTVLEMNGPPPTRPVVHVPDLSITPVESPRTDWYRHLFAEIGRDWLWTSRLVMPEADLAAMIADPAVEIRVLRDGAGRDVGLLELDFRGPGECEIVFLGVVPDLHGRGAGRMLMAAALARAWAAPIARLHLHTCTFDHPAALPFYIRSGFRPVARRIEVMADPRLTGLLPGNAAPHVPRIA